MVATTDPVTGTVISTINWGHSVYVDVLRLSNVVVARQTPGSGFTTTSASYVTITNLNTTSYTKNGGSTASQLLVEIAMTAWRSGATGSLTVVGVQVNGVDTDVCQLTFNALTDHRSMAGFAYLPALAAGTYTVTPRVKTAAGTFNHDTGDQWCLKISEVPL